MKRTIALIISALILVASLSACSVNVNLSASTEPETAPATETVQPTSAPATLAPAETEPQIGELGDYVKTLSETTYTFSDGKSNTLRIPEILLDSKDAKYANNEIKNRFGEAVKGSDNYTGAYELDYEAYLTGKVLSIVIFAKYEGGNSYGLGYNFDVMSGDRLDNAAVCAEAGKTLSETRATLVSALELYYDQKWGNLQGNDTMRKKTFADDNIDSAVMYLDSSGYIYVLIDTFAAVGGGHFAIKLAIG